MAADIHSFVRQFHWKVILWVFSKADGNYEVITPSSHLLLRVETVSHNVIYGTYLNFILRTADSLPFTA